MELDRTRNDSENRIVFSTIDDSPCITVANILPKSPFRLAAETNRPVACAPRNGKKFGFLLTRTQSELFCSSCDKRTSRMHGWCSSRLRVEPIFWSDLLTRSVFALYRRISRSLIVWSRICCRRQSHGGQAFLGKFEDG